MKPKSLLVFMVGLVSFIWMLNPPGLNLDDTIPLLGNLDEAAAMIILLNCLAYFGLDLTRFFRPDSQKTDAPAKPARPVMDADAEVVTK